MCGGDVLDTLVYVEELLRPPLPILLEYCSSRERERERERERGAEERLTQTERKAMMIDRWRHVKEAIKKGENEREVEWKREEREKQFRVLSSEREESEDLGEKGNEKRGERGYSREERRGREGGRESRDAGRKRY